MARMGWIDEDEEEKKLKALKKERLRDGDAHPAPAVAFPLVAFRATANDKKLIRITTISGSPVCLFSLPFPMPLRGAKAADIGRQHVLPSNNPSPIHRMISFFFYNSNAQFSGSSP